MVVNEANTTLAILTSTMSGPESALLSLPAKRSTRGITLCSKSKRNVLRRDGGGAFSLCILTSFEQSESQIWSLLQLGGDLGDDYAFGMLFLEGIVSVLSNHRRLSGLSKMWL